MSTLFRPGEFYGVPQFGSHGAGFDVRASAAQPRLGVRDIAAEFNVHPVHLARAFRAVYGTTPAAYRRERVSPIQASADVDRL